MRAVQRLRDRHQLSDRVEVVEGGTAGLLPLLADARRVIIVDAIDTGARPGTLVRLDGEDWARAFESRMTQHDVGLVDLLGAAQLSGAWPERLVLHGVQPASTAIGTELGAPVAAALEPLVDADAGELGLWGVAFAPGLEGAPCA